MGLVKMDTRGKPQTLLDVRDDSGREVMSLALDNELVFKLSETPDTVNIVRLNHTISGDGWVTKLPPFFPTNQLNAVGGSA